MDEKFLYGIGSGWIPLVEEVAEKVAEWNKEHENNPILFIDVKEKFGLLNIYLSNYTEELRNKISEVMERSATICEKCGSTNNVKRKEDHGWITTLCDKCRQEKMATM